MSQHNYSLPTDIQQQIFRAYDIRGIVQQSLTTDVVYAIGLAIGSEAQQKQQKQVIIARDGRLSGPELSDALSHGLQDSGCDVIDIGAVATPVLYYATHVLETRTGVMLTGSHNPANYNGLKIVIDGVTLANESIMALYHRIQQQNFTRGKASYEKLDICEQYITKITDDIKLKRQLKIVVDCGNGIAGGVAPQLFSRLGCDVLPLYCDVDGHFPNHHPDPSQTENVRELIDTVIAEQADIGIAFDGDGDRLGVVSSQGKIVWADRQMILFSKYLLQDNPGAKIIYDVKCSRLLDQMIKDFGGQPIMWKTGHSLVKAKLKQEKALLAGEMSGHIFFNDRWYGFDDALYSAARLLEILSTQPQSSDEIFSEIPDSINTPELKIAIKESSKFVFMQKLTEQASFPQAQRVIDIDGLRVDYIDGWGLVRASNTTPYLILRFEADNQAALQHIMSEFASQIRAIDDSLVFPV